MEKVTPKKIAWSGALEARFVDAGFTPAIIEELKTLGEIYQAEDLIVISRVEALDADSFEVVWMASLGRGLAKWSKTFFDGARRAGARYIRFHIDEHEKPLLRLLKRWQPQQVNDACFDGLVYRVDLSMEVN